MAYIGRTPTGSILTGADIADGSISTAKLADTAVSTAKIADDAVTSAKATGFGKIGQVLNVVNHTQASSSSTSFVDMGMSLSITPSATSSKILIQVYLNGAFINTGSSEGIQTRLQVTPSGGSASTIAVYNGYGLQAESNQGSATLSGSTLHSPSSTTAQVYKIQYRSKNGNAVILGANDSGNSQLADTSTNSMITLMEVLA